MQLNKLNITEIHIIINISKILIISKELIKLTISSLFLLNLSFSKNIQQNTEK
jgi:hypothetical protein